MSIDVKIDPQYDNFLKSSKDQKRLVELLLEIQLICLNDGNFSSHSNIDSLRSMNDTLSNKIISKKIILDKAINALNEVGMRCEKLHEVNIKDAESYIAALG